MKQRLLIFIVAYNAEKHIEKVLDRIPKEKLVVYDYEILIIDDQSQDTTFERAVEYQKSHSHFRIVVLYNYKNQGYGGNQKIGYRYAQIHHFDIVLLLHGDGQYAPEEFERLVRPIADGKADAVFGSRMMNKRDALKGKMPYYKFLGNIILTHLQNTILHTNLTEFHTGYRAYKVTSLAKLPIDRNSNDFHFDTQIIIQLLISKQKILEVPIPTHYGEEICYVNGFTYAYNILKASVQSRLQNYGIYYRREYDLNQTKSFDEPKTNFASAHSYTFNALGKGQLKILEIGAINSLFAQYLKANGHQVDGIGDLEFNNNDSPYHYYNYSVIEQIQDFPDCSRYDIILLLDIIEHLNDPELFLDRLRNGCKMQKPRILITTPNIAFMIMRLQLLLGNFNYGRRGILDMGHKRLFTFSTLKKMCVQSGFLIKYSKGIPAPAPLVIKSKSLANLFLFFNKILIGLSKTLFSYQIFAELEVTPTVENLSKFLSINSKQQC